MHDFGEGKFKNRYHQDYGYIKHSISILDKDSTKYKRLDSMNIGQFYGPFTNKYKDVFFTVVMRKSPGLFYSFQEAQFFQNPGIGDELFQNELDSLKYICKTESLMLGLATKKYNSPYIDGSVYTNVHRKLKGAEDMIIEFLNSSTKYSILQLDKIKMIPHQKNMIQLVQNISDNNKFDVIHYEYIRIKKMKK